MPDSSLYKRVLQELTDIINKNRNVKEYKLPSERMLAIKFNASRPPIRVAYQKLIEDGLVEVVHGKGYFIKNSDKLRLIKPQVLFVTPSMKTNFMQQIHSGIIKFCENNNMDLAIKITDLNEKKEKKILETITYSNYDGLILFPVDNESYSEPLLKLSISKYPMVIIDRYIKNLNISFVATDNHKAMLDTVKFLHAKRYKSPAYVSFEPTVATSVEERINGYNNGMLKYYGYTSAANLLILKSNNKDYIYNTIKAFLEEYPQTDALIVNDVYLSAAHLAASDLHKKVPDKIRFVVFDNEISFAEKKLIQPYIIEQESEKIGYTAASFVYKQITNDKHILSKQFSARIIEKEY